MKKEIKKTLIMRSETMELPDNFKIKRIELNRKLGRSAIFFEETHKEGTVSKMIVNPNYNVFGKYIFRDVTWVERDFNYPTKNASLRISGYKPKDKITVYGTVPTTKRHRPHATQKHTVVVKSTKKIKTIGGYRLQHPIAATVSRVKKPKKQRDIRYYHKEMKRKRFYATRIKFVFPKSLNELYRKNLTEVGVLFTYLLRTLRPEYLKHAPYTVRIKRLVVKNQFTTGAYVAINRDNGTLDLHLNLKKIQSGAEFPLYRFVWLLAHEFRHKIQSNDERIKSVINFPNWSNFNTFMQKQYKKPQDTIDHVFHEINPAEVDAHIFACELTGIMFPGTKFNICDQTLGLLGKKDKK